MAIEGGKMRALTVGLVLSLLALCILTASMRGVAAAYAKEAEALYRQKRNQERELGEIRAEVRHLKSPAEIEARLATMKAGGVVKAETVAKTASVKAPKEASRGR